MKYPHIVLEELKRFNEKSYQIREMKKLSKNLRKLLSNQSLLSIWLLEMKKIYMLNMIKSNIYQGYTLGLESKKINPTELT